MAVALKEILVEGCFVASCCTLHSAGQLEGQCVSGEQA